MYSVPFARKSLCAYRNIYCYTCVNMPEGNLEQDIANLEQQLAEKRQALETNEPSAEQGPSDHELVQKVIGEQIQKQMPSYQQAQAQPGDEDTDASWSDPALTEQVQSLVTIAFTKSLDEAIGEAVKTNNAALIDAFHDLLRDELLKELISRGKLKPPATG